MSQITTAWGGGLIYWYLEGMLLSFDVIIHLQIVIRAVRHLSPASLAIAHTFGFSPHPARSYLRNSLATTGAFPKNAFRSVHNAGTLQATTVLSRTPLYSKSSIWVVSTELYKRGRSEHSTPALQPVLSVLSGYKTLVGNNQLSLLSVFYAGILGKTLCGTCIHTACVIISLSYFAWESPFRIPSREILNLSLFWRLRLSGNHYSARRSLFMVPLAEPVV